MEKVCFLLRIFDEKDIKSHTFKNSVVHNVRAPITLGIPSSSTVRGTPSPRSPSPIREFELIRVSGNPSGELLNVQPTQDEDEESSIQCEIERSCKSSWQVCHSVFGCNSIAKSCIHIRMFIYKLTSIRVFFFFNLWGSWAEARTNLTSFAM